MNGNMATYTNRNYLQRFGIVWMMIMLCLFLITLRADIRSSGVHFSIANGIIYNLFGFHFLWILFASFFKMPGISIFAFLSFGIFIGYLSFLISIVLKPFRKSLTFFYAVIIIPFFITLFTLCPKTIFFCSIFSKFINRFDYFAFRTSFFHFDLPFETNRRRFAFADLTKERHLYKATAICLQIKNASFLSQSIL